MKRIISVLISVMMVAGVFTSLPISSSAAKKKAKKVSLKKSSATLTIKKTDKKTTYGKTSIKLKKAKGVKINKVTYKSTNKKVAKVSKKGKVTAKKKGTANIKVKVTYKFKKKPYKKTLTFKVKVIKVDKTKKTKKTSPKKTTKTTKATSKPATSAPAKTTEAYEPTTEPVQTTAAQTDPGETTEPTKADDASEQTEPAKENETTVQTDPVETTIQTNPETQTEPTEPETPANPEETTTDNTAAPTMELPTYIPDDTGLLPTTSPFIATTGEAIAPTNGDYPSEPYSGGDIQGDTNHCVEPGSVPGVTDPSWTGVTKPDGSPYYDYTEPNQGDTGHCTDFDTIPGVTDPSWTGVTKPDGSPYYDYTEPNQGDTGHCTDFDTIPGETDPSWTGVTKPDGSPYYELYETTAPATEQATQNNNSARSNLLAAAPELNTYNPATLNDVDFLKKLSDFSNKLYEMSAEQENSNYTMSPVSVYMALSLLYYSGDDGVKSDIKDLTKMSDSDIEKTAQLFTSLICKRENNGQILSQLNLTNSIWLDKGQQFNINALQQLSEKAYCDSYETPFSTYNQEANKAVREFVKEKTNGKIDKDFALNDDTLFALINTLYFKDIWSFDEEVNTSYQNFKTPNGTKECEFIHREYLEGQIQSTPVCDYFYTTTYAGYKIKFILPKQGCTLKQAMSSENLSKVNDTKDYVFVDNNDTEHYTKCVFPAFKIESDTPLKDILQNNGALSNAFSNFTSNLIDGNLYVSDIKHKTVLEVNKQGVEGAAVTIIATATSAAPMRPQVYHTFTLDRSFGFIITDRADVVLFTGQVTNP